MCNVCMRVKQWFPIHWHSPRKISYAVFFFVNPNDLAEYLKKQTVWNETLDLCNIHSGKKGKKEEKKEFHENRGKFIMPFCQTSSWTERYSTASMTDILHSALAHHVDQSKSSLDMFINVELTFCKQLFFARAKLAFTMTDWLTIVFDEPIPNP